MFHVEQLTCVFIHSLIKYSPFIFRLHFSRIFFCKRRSVFCTFVESKATKLFEVNNTSNEQ